MAPGDKLGPYEIEAQIAEGGMGVVYRAKNRVTGQLRALKVVREELGRNREFVDRFVREATIASAVRHPNLVETLEPGIEGQTIYLPMELLIGETLSARLRRMKRMSSHETATILASICEAVQLLHDQKLVHRDLKPGNIFLAKVNGVEVPKVIDLGTARDVGDAEHTQTGMVVGSPFYMAPEQAEGRRDVDGRADQYALGVVAYQMVTGARPYESDDTRSALAKLMRGDPYKPPSRVFAGVAPSVEAAIVRSLSREREQRFARIVDFGRALAIASSGMDSAHTVGDLGDAVEAAKAMIAARPVLTVGGGAETQIRDVESMGSGSVTPSGSVTLGQAGQVTPTPILRPIGPTGFAAPPPPSAGSTTAASGGGARTAAVIGVVALLAVAGAVGLWVMSSRQAAQLQPRAVSLDPTESVPPPPTLVIAPLPPPTDLAVPMPTTVALAPPSSVVVAPPPTSFVPPPTSVTRPPPTSSTSGSGQHTHSHRDHPPATTAGAPCGAATGIPCVE